MRNENQLTSINSDAFKSIVTDTGKGIRIGVSLACIRNCQDTSLVVSRTTFTLVTEVIRSHYGTI